jgi:hypothetical protein
VSRARAAALAIAARPEAAVFVVAAIGYALAAGPGVSWMDAGELTTAGATLGVSHPPGHPLHALLARAATLVPLGEIAFRVTLVSAVAMAAALAGVVAIARALLGATGPALLAAAAAALVAGLAPAAAINATRAEVYAPTAALLTWATALALRARRDGAPGPALLAAFACALAAALHPPTAAAAALPLAIGLGARLGRRCVRLLAAALGLGALALAIYAYLPVRAAAPSPALLVWGDPSSWRGLADHVAGAVYQGNFALAGAAGRAGGAGALLLEGAGLGVALAGLVGLGLGALTGLRGAGWPLAAAAAIVVEVALQRAFNPDLRGYLLPALLLLAAGVAPLVDGLRRLAGAAAAGRAGALLAGVVLAPIALAAALSPPGPPLDRGDDPTRWFDATVARLPPGPGVYVTDGDHTLFAALYERLVAGARPDLAIAHVDLARDAWFATMLDRMVPDLYVPWVDDGLKGAVVERLVTRALERGEPVAVDRPGGAIDVATTPLGRAYRLGGPPGPASTPAPPLDFAGDVGARVARLIALDRARFELGRGALGDAARAAGVADELGDDLAALDAARLDPARPSLAGRLPALTFGFVSEPWQRELLIDDLRWCGGLPPRDVATDAPAERRLHRAWRDLLAGGAPAIAAAAPAIAALGRDAEVATNQLLIQAARPLAEPWLDGYVARHPDDARTLGLYASLRANRGDLPGAIALFERAVAIAPDDADAWARLGVVRARRGDRDGARDAWARALALDPRRGDVRAWLAAPR